MSLLAKKIEIGLISLSALVAAAFAVHSYQNPEELQYPSMPDSALNGNTAEVERADIDTQLLELSNLFGIPVIEEASEDYQELPETPLNLQLFGTIAHQDPNMSSALISANGDQPIRYFVEQQIAGQSELVHIGMGYVVLRRNGEDEILRLPMIRDIKTGPEVENRIYQ